MEPIRDYKPYDHWPVGLTVPIVKSNIEVRTWKFQRGSFALWALKSKPSSFSAYVKSNGIYRAKAIDRKMRKRWERTWMDGFSYGWSNKMGDTSSIYIPGYLGLPGP